MKKTTLALACLVGLALMASCKKDVQPTVSINTDPECVSANAEIYSGDQITVGFSATGENLAQFELSATNNGNILYSSTDTFTGLESYSFTESFIIEAVGTVTITGTVTDAKGHTATASFNIFCNEKPNAKFVGFYEGNALITGTMNIINSGMDPMQQEMQDDPVPVRLSVEAGENFNEVIAHVTINEQENPGPIQGVVEGNKMVFTAINSTYNMTYQNFSIPLNVTYDIICTLNEGMLDLEGTCKGDGEIYIPPFINGSIEMEGTVNGSLTKTE